MRTPGRRRSSQSGSGDSLGPSSVHAASLLSSDSEPFSGAGRSPPGRVSLSDDSAQF